MLQVRGVPRFFRYCCSAQTVVPILRPSHGDVQVAIAREGHTEPIPAKYTVHHNLLRWQARTQLHAATPGFSVLAAGAALGT